jgi:hypothetical protein
LARDYGGDADAVASQLLCPAAHVQEALRYAHRYPEEIEAATAAGSPSYEELKQILPDLHLIEVVP